MTTARSVNSEVSWRRGVWMIGVVSSQRTPTTRTLPSAMGTTSSAPGTCRRRPMARATSRSGEMITSIGMCSRENRSAQIGSR